MSMKFITIFSALVAGITADDVAKCASCFEATGSDCLAAFNQMPTSGTLSGNDHSIWTSGSCTITYFPEGKGPNAADVHGVAQTLVNDCCWESTCSGIAYDTGASTALENGCICMAEVGKTPCQCGGGTPAFDCIGH